MLAHTLIEVLRSGLSIHLEKTPAATLLTVCEDASKPSRLTSSNYVFDYPSDAFLDEYLSCIIKDLASSISVERQRQKTDFAASVDLESEVEEE